jgi:hypothetical protein
MHPRYEVSEKTVFDQSTGLTWQREVSNRAFTWEQAKKYAATLDLSGGDWRLPTSTSRQRRLTNRGSYEASLQRSDDRSKEAR